MTTVPPGKLDLMNLEALQLSDLEAIRLLLKGGSVIDWHRLNFENREQTIDFIRAHEFDVHRPEDALRLEQIKEHAIRYLRDNFEFPIPKPVSQADLPALLELASGKGHRQLCACTILKIMHIIHHVDGRELLFRLPISDQDLFQLVEEKVYRVVGRMLAEGAPIVEFTGGRKHTDSLYTKLLSKQETIAAQIYDKLRFRIVTRSYDQVFPTLNYLMHSLFPFNYVIPGQSTNTMFHFRNYCEAHPHLKAVLPRLQPGFQPDEPLTAVDNRFTASTYRVIHFVVDMPVRLRPELLAKLPEGQRELGAVIFALVEFQVVDRVTEQNNELGDASHAAYKRRQRAAVMRRLKLGEQGGEPVG